MAAKKTPVKATKAKKTVAKKAEPVKKAAPAKKTVAARPKPPERPAPAPVAKPSVPSAPKSTPKPTPAAVIKAPPPPPKLARAAASPAAVVPTPAKATSSLEPRTPTLARPVMRHIEPIDSGPAAGDSDDPDSQEMASPNLLAGPRNVKPYIPRRGEQYMNKEQLDHFRHILNTWKQDLMHEVDRTVLHMKDEAANFPDPNDRATQESEFSLELRTRDRERKLIRKIEEAIKRIDDGSYGYCNETGEEIGIKRLEARPVATLCVEAQERRERREKQYGDRDDRYR
jgi:DnaK suppressor protein